MAGDYHYFEGITFRNTGIAIEAGQKLIAGAKGLTVKHAKFTDIGTAVHSDWSGSAGFYIADNDMTGRENLDRLFTWYAIKPWVDFPDFAERGKLKSFYAVSIYGQGHVMAYNRVRGFHDGHRPRHLRDAGRLARHAARAHAGVDRHLQQRRLGVCTTTASRPTARRRTSACCATAASTRR